MKGVLKRLKSGASLTVLDDLGMMPLHVAADAGYLEIVQALVDAGAEIDGLSETGQTPLHVAAIQHTEIAKYLMDRGADIQREDETGATPLHVAAGAGNMTLAELLVDAGAELEGEEFDGNTPLDNARSYGRVDVAELLIAHGANTRGWPAEDVLEHCRERAVYVADMVRRFTLGNNAPLFQAIENQDLQRVRRALKPGADINCGAPDGSTPLAAAASAGNAAIVQCLIDAGADPNIPDVTGFIPLHDAAIHGNLETMRILLNAGSRIDARDGGYSPLEAAVDQSQYEAVKLLVESGADTRGLSIDDLLTEAKYLAQFDEDDEPPPGVRQRFGKRTPGGRMARRHFQTLQSLGFEHFASLVACSDTGCETYVFTSKKHKAFALLQESTHMEAAWMSFTAFHEDGTIYALSNIGEDDRLGESQDVALFLESKRILDPAALFECFRERRPKKKAADLSDQDFVEWLLATAEITERSSDNDDELEDEQDDD